MATALLYHQNRLHKQSVCNKWCFSHAVSSQPLTEHHIFRTSDHSQHPQTVWGLWLQQFQSKHTILTSASHSVNTDRQIKTCSLLLRVLFVWLPTHLLSHLHLVFNLVVVVQHLIGCSLAKHSRMYTLLLNSTFSLFLFNRSISNVLATVY